MMVAAPSRFCELALRSSQLPSDEAFFRICKRLEALGVASMDDPELDRRAAEAGMRGDEGDGEGAALGAMMRGGGGGGEGEGEAFGAGFKSGSDVLSTLVLKITASREAVRAQREKEAEARSRVSHEKELLAKGGKQAHVKHAKA